MTLKEAIAILESTDIYPPYETREYPYHPISYEQGYHLAIQKLKDMVKSETKG